MRLHKVQPEMKVVIIDLHSTKGIFVNKKHLDVREVGVTGTITGPVPGHGGDVWWIKHDETSTVGAYVYDEFREVKDK